jgi:hypothetical protein
VPHLQTDSLSWRAQESCRSLERLRKLESLSKQEGVAKDCKWRCKSGWPKKKHMCKHQKSLGFLDLSCSQWGDNLTAHSKSYYSAHKLSNKTSTVMGMGGDALTTHNGGVRWVLLGQVPRAIMYRFILQNPQNHFANPHENHYLMEHARYRLLSPFPCQFGNSSSSGLPKYLRGISRGTMVCTEHVP